MAISVWNGTTDSDPLVDGNFTVAPTSTTTVVIPAYSVTAGDDSVDTIDGASSWPDADTIAAMTIEPGGSFTIGTRAEPLTINMTDATASDIDIAGTGTYFLTPVNWDTINITEAGSATATGGYACNLTAMTHAAGNGAGIINIRCEENQSIGIGAENGVTTEVESVNITGGDLFLGSGCVQIDGSDAVDLTISGGNITTDCPLGAVVMYGGTLTVLSGAVAALTINGGVCNYNGTGAIAALTIGSGGIFDASKQTQAAAFTLPADVNLYTGATFLDPHSAGTLAVSFSLNQCSLDDVTLDLGTNFTIARSAI